MRIPMRSMDPARRDWMLAIRRIWQEGVASRKIYRGGATTTVVNLANRPSIVLDPNFDTEVTGENGAMK